MVAETKSVTYIDLFVKLGVVVVYLPRFLRVHVIDDSQTRVVVLRQEVLVLLLIEVTHGSRGRLTLVAIPSIVIGLSLVYLCIK